MKRLFSTLVLAVLLSFASLVHSTPFLICDVPDPAEQIVFYIVYQDGVEIARPAAETNGSLRMDLQTVTPGVYDWTAVAVNAWGASLPSDPYISPSGATKPANTRMEL